MKIWKFLFPWTLVSFVLKNYCWHEFQDFCGSNHLRAYNHVDTPWLMMSSEQEKFFFVWMLNAFVYLINCCWRKFQGFCGKKHLWVCSHVDAFRVITPSKKRYFCLFEWWLLRLIWSTFVEMNSNFVSILIETQIEIKIRTPKIEK